MKLFPPLHLAALLALAALVVSGCRCGGPETRRQFGELGVVYPVDEQTTRTDRDATFDFHSVFMGQAVTVKLPVKNLGAGSLTLSTLTKVEGDAAVIGGEGDAQPVWDVKFTPGQTLGASEYVELEATFTPPQSTEAQVDHRLVLELRADNTRPGEETARITLLGRGVSGVCELPRTIDFGSVAVDDVGSFAFVLRNPTQLPASAEIAEPYSSSGDHQAFGFAEDSLRGKVTLDPNTEGTVALEFRPTEARQYLAFIKARASAQCPEQTLTVTGTGVLQVLSWTPATVDCGYVTPGAQTHGEVTFQNASSNPVELSGLATLNDIEFGVVPAQGQDPAKLSVPAAVRSAEGEWVSGEAKLSLFCKPSVVGPRQTQLVFTTNVARQPTGAVPVKVFGGGPDIEVVPSPTLNFGKVAYFANANPPAFQKRKLTVMNAGTAPPNPDLRANLRLGKVDANGNFGPPYVLVTPLNADTSADEFVVTLPASYDANVGLQAKAGFNTADLLVTVTPKSVGLKEANLTIFSNDPDEPEVTIKATANAVVLPPCNYTVSPSALSFGLISPPDYRDLAFTLTNNGTQAGDVCLLSGLDIGAGSSPFYSLPLGPIESRELAPGETLQVLVRVWPQGATPTGVSNVPGTVEFFLSSPTKPQATVTLAAQLAPSCLTIAPDELDYGTVQVGCASITRTFTIYNTCSQPVTLNGFTMQAAAGQPAGGPNCPGTAPCPEFQLVQSPSIPSGGLLLNPGSSAVTFQARYKPLDYGADTGAVAISATQGGSNVNYVVALHARGDQNGVQTDVFTQDAKPKADILLVIDNSCSMGDDQQSLAANFGSFIQYAIDTQVDYHIAVTTTDFDATGEQGRFVYGPSHPEKVLTPATVDVENKFKAKVNLGINGSGYEHDADPALAALTAPLVNADNVGFLRDDAALAVVAITDENDQSANTTAYYLNGFWNIKGFNRKTLFTFNAIAGFSAACKSILASGDSGELAFYVGQTNGVKDDICTPDWAATLETLGKTAFGFRSNFFLTSAPDLMRGPITITIDGINAPSVDTHGATVWQYDAVANSVNFETMFVPEPGQTLTITYFTTCYP